MRKISLLLFSILISIGSLQSQDFDASNYSVLFLTKDVTSENILEEQGIIDDLRSRGFTVDFTYNNAGSINVPVDIDFSFETANEYDLIIIGRGVSSGDFTEIEEWAAVTTPVIHFSSYIMRSSRLNFFNSTVASREVSDATTIAPDRIAQVKITDHPIFTGLDMDGDSLINYHTWFHDYIGVPSENFENDNNATLLASWSTADSPSNGNVAIALWEEATETYNGSGTTVAADRLYFQMGSDDASAPKIRNFTAFTDQSTLAFHNAIKLLLGAAPDGELIPVLKVIEPIANYRMEEGTSTSVADEIGGGEGEIRNGDGITWESCGVGNSINLGNATNEDAILWVNDHPNINFSDQSFSISLLAKIDPFTNTGEMNLLLKGDNKSDGTHLENGTGKWYAIATKDNQLRFAIDDNVTKTQLGVDIDETSFPANQWNHILAVRDRTNDVLVLYVNGEMVGMLMDNTEESIETTDLPLVIGNYHSGLRKVNGNLDEIALYDFAFTAQEVADLFAEVNIDTSCEVISTILTSSVKEQLALDIDLSITPNPFIEDPQIQFTLTEKTPIQLSIYNTAGQLIKTEDQQILSAGTHTQRVATQDLVAGVYFFQLNTNSGTITTKMIKLK